MNDGLDRQEAIRKSALWAAYGDALGFITELADKKSLKLRTDKSRIITTIPWNRKVGGQLGVTVELPAGCYSDDTQLRLATCRAIRGDGKFDVEAFAKVELPVWLSYALGAGRGTKSAAVSMTRKDTTWANNFFDTKTSRYVDCGGNGAAIRIQPHVWSSCDLKGGAFLPDVLSNAICTHGHPRGILGAVFHSLCLAHALYYKKIPGPDEWRNFIDMFYKIPEMIRKIPELSDYWLPTWDKIAESNIKLSCRALADECLKDIGVIQLIRDTAKSSSDVQYATMAREIGAMSDEYRGAGTKTAILAVVLSWMFKINPRGAIEVGSNLLGSDTDSISSMAGAIIGSVADYDPPGEICDETYIEEEAFRMSAISNGLKTESFIYPDLFSWDVGSVQSDFVKIDGDRLVVSGLGHANAVGELYKLKADDEIGWQWLQLNIGQKILAKRRLNPDVISSTHLAPGVEKEKSEVSSSKIIQETENDAGKKQEVKPVSPEKQPLISDQPVKESEASLTHLAPKVEKEISKVTSVEIRKEVLHDVSKEQEVKPVAPQKPTMALDQSAKEADTVSSKDLAPKVEKEASKVTPAEVRKEVPHDVGKEQESKAVASQKQTIIPDEAAKEANTISSTHLAPEIEKEKSEDSSSGITQEKVPDTFKEQEAKPVAPQKPALTPDQSAKEAETVSSKDLTPKVEKEPSKVTFVEVVQETLSDVDKELETKLATEIKQPLTLDQAINKVLASGFDPEVIGRVLLEFSERDNGVEMVIGLSAIIAKIYRAKIDKQK
ncbi:MAG: ADP-ribosylglycohydrolase family protein [Pseudomonadota bacterium]